MILLIKHRVLETHSVCAFSGDKDVCELCRESRRAKPLETFSLCVTDALGCSPRAASPRLGVFSACKACPAVLLGPCCGTTASTGSCQDTGNGKDLQVPCDVFTVVWMSWAARYHRSIEGNRLQTSCSSRRRVTSLPKL